MVDISVIVGAAQNAEGVVSIGKINAAGEVVPPIDSGFPIVVINILGVTGDFDKIVQELTSQELDNDQNLIHKRKWRFRNEIAKEEDISTLISTGNLTVTWEYAKQYIGRTETGALITDADIT